jgi:hypothetical protein
MAYDRHPPTYAFLVAGIIYGKHQLFVEMGSLFLPRVALNHDLPDLHLLSNWDYRCESPFTAKIDYIFNYEYKVSLELHS